MDIFEALHTRRSIRKYKNQDVPDELVEKILAAAMMAPSAGNQQPWQFIVITDESQKEKMATAHPYVNMVRTAPLAILVCGDLTKEKFNGYWPQDCSASMENMLLGPVTG
ncbi:nitroreductase family protein [Desulfogranum japonicum]|uniref:nitroreductase family protein n=1 Tax=Desulfogranum japonicum TaxID=231447 RepID=UPI000683E3DD|nr:nitroreductase family protein [Desulfogranum japonicum]